MYCINTIKRVYEQKKKNGKQIVNNITKTHFYRVFTQKDL